ncbi:MAG: phosphoribosylglycinamide formyltransferase [Oscillospiraceae bacterium]|nr:phosphoribosylglycinamide formyltransferase [Oscillospiraceae bacterium]
MKNIIVLVSGGGTNLQALIDKQEQGEIKNGNISCVISSNPNAYALQRAEQHGVKTHVLPRKNFENNHAYSLALLDMLKQEQADLIVLAGFMIILDKIIIQAYENKIINVHPALIPAFCGDGFYGLHVHEKALEKGVKLTGATVHFVNEICDGGAIILQKAVAIQKGDTPEILQKRVMEQAEWQILPQAVSLFCEERLQIENNHVWIID